MHITVLLPIEFKQCYLEHVAKKFRQLGTVHEVFFTSLLNKDEFIQEVSGSEVVVLTLETIDHEVLDALPDLKLIANFGAGYDNVDLEAAQRFHVEVTNAPGANASSVAEMALSLILSCCRNIPFLNKQTRSGVWELIPGIELKGKTCGIIGLGRIGKELVKMLSGFEVKTIACETYRDNEFADQWDVTFTDLDGIARDADIISLHVPALPQTKHLIGSDFLGKLQKNPVLINTSRGSIIDEEALLHALRRGVVCCAGLDVLSCEPMGADHPFRQMPNVIITSHIGGSTEDAIIGISELVLEDLSDLLRGEKPRHSVVVEG